MLALNTLRLATVLTHLSKCYNHKCNHLCDTMWNLWASLCKQILLENSPLTQIANLYKLSSCWSHARCRNLSISIPKHFFFFATIWTYVPSWNYSRILHWCVCCVQGFAFYPKAIIWTYVLSWNYSRTQHWWSAGANLQNGFTLFSQTW